ncbi:MAG: mRNA surveillance protein pelota [Candidatus Thermoplasmatota archaeon]|nr:mRNA surveillance protein pelota [Candidatus Thermoplasmatota archaeon]
MNILHQNTREGSIKVRIQSTDDCWHLYNIIEEGDLAAAFTHRTSAAQPGDKTRAGKAEKEGMYLTIRVTGVSFQNFSDRLRVHGVIEQGPQDLGKHHTFNLEPGSELTVIKNWRPYHLKRLKEAVESSQQPSVVVVSMDEDQATIALIHQYGVEHLATIDSGRSGKFYESASSEKEYYGDLLAKLQQFQLPLVIVGPGFAKENFVAYARDRGGLSNYVVDSTGQAGMAGVKEALNRGIVERLVEASSLARESRLVESFLAALARGEPVAYGEEEVERAVTLGAAEQVLVTTGRVRSHQPLLERAEKTGATVSVISDVHEGGEKLSALGGLAAMLRYPIS